MGEPQDVFKLMRKEFQGNYSTVAVRANGSGEEFGQDGTTASQV